MRRELMRRVFWQHVLESDMAVPVEQSLNELTAELVTMLGSANPVERDEVAYPVLANWLAGGVYDDLLVSFGDSIADGLRPGLGDPESDTVFRRSFSALVLTESIARDNVAHVLPVDAVLSWADRSIGWYTRERDLRRWVAEKGRASAVAHGADLLGALAQSRHLHGGHLQVLLDVVAERVSAPTGAVFVDGEDDHLAAAVLTIVQRDLIDADHLDAWAAGLGEALSRPPRHPDDERWPSSAARNISNFLRALHVHLAIGVAPQGATISFARPPVCRPDLLLALLGAIPRRTPWLYASPEVADPRATTGV